MSRYYVVLPDGNRFGPANTQLLSVWVAEGRVVPDTVVEDAVTGQRLFAGQVAGVFFGAQQPQPSPYAYPHVPPAGPVYQQPLPVFDPSDPNWASPARPPANWSVAAAATLGLSVFMCFNVAGLVLAVTGLVFAVAAMVRRERGSGCALAAAAFLCLVTLAAQVVLPRQGL